MGRRLRELQTVAGSRGFGAGVLRLVQFLFVSLYTYYSNGEIFPER